MRRLILLIFFLSSVSLVSAYNTADYPPISIQNAANLQEVDVLGDGTMNDVVSWLPDGGIVVGGSRGLYVYPSLQSEAHFIELGINVQSLLFADETLFFSDGETLYAYNLVDEQIIYSVEGQRPLAVSNHGTMLAYEVDMGVRVLEIATGTVLYDLNYEGILSAEYDDGAMSVEHSMVFAQFCLNDGGVIVRRISNYQGTGLHGMGGQVVESDIWMFNVSPQPSLINYGFMSDSSNIAALDASGNFFAIDGSHILRAETEISLNLQEGERLESEYGGNYTIQGNLLAIPIVNYSNNSQRTTKIWDVTTGELVANLPARGYITFSPDASKVAIGRHIFELATGEELAFLQTDTYRLIRGLPDRVLHYGADDSIRLLDAASLEEIAVLPLRMSELQDYPYMANVDGSFSLLAKNQGLAIRIDGNTGAEIARYVSDEIPLSHLYFSPDMRYVVNEYAMEPASVVEMWDAQTGEAISLPFPYSPFYPYFYRDSTVIAWDSSTKEVVFYDMLTASVIHRYPVTLGAIEGFEVTLSLSPDQRYMVIGSVPEHIVWSVESEIVVLEIEGDVWDWNFSPSSIFFAYQSDGLVHIVNLRDGTTTIEIEAGGYPGFVTDRIFALEDFYNYENSRYFDVITGEEVEAPVYQPQPIYEANDLHFFGDVMGVRVECNNHHVLTILNTGFVWSMSVSSDGKLLYINYSDGRVGVWAVVE